MIQESAYIWGLNASSNPMNVMVNRISRRNGMVNGFAYGYLVRHQVQFQSIHCSPTEDVESSCRVFHHDGVVLRYMMYCARTIFKAPDGINLLYESAVARKAAEEKSIELISEEFPQLLSVRVGAERRRTQAAMNFRFHHVGKLPLSADGRVYRPKVREEPAASSGVESAAAAAQRAKRAAVEKMVLSRCV